MTEIFFYHLDGIAAEDVLPDLLQRGLKRNLKMSVEITDIERLSAFSTRLWSIEDVAFIPHGMADDPHPKRQSIWLTSTPENSNDAEYRFYVGGALPAADSGYERASVLFDGGDVAQVMAARHLWRSAKARGCLVKYWKKDESGRWADLASQTHVKQE